MLRRLNIEEEERQQEAKAKKEQEEKAKQEEETDLETTDEIIKTDEEKEISVAEIVESKQELTSSEPVITNSKPLITDSEPIITNSVTDSDSTITNSKQEEQEEKQDLESKQVDLDSIMDKIDYYELAEKYNLYDTLPAFQIFTDELIYDSETGEGNFELAKSLIIDEKGEEYWRNMNPKDIKQWDNTGLFTVAYTDINDDIREYRGYDYYSKDTIKEFLKENTTVAEELSKQYMPNDSKKKEQDSKDIEIKKDKGREYEL